MSRIDLKKKLYAKKSNLNGFDFDALSGPRVYDLLSPNDIGDLTYIASSLKYNGKIEKKHKLIDEIMVRRGFQFDKRGTNRSVYKFPDIPRIIAKIAVDRIGMSDSPREFKNQQLIKPYCCKMFDVADSGVAAIVEKFNPITSIEEYDSVKEDIYNMYIQITGKYIVYDIGTDRFMNVGLRVDNVTGQYFGPGVIDYPYVYEVDGNKLKCKGLYMSNGKPTLCDGDIEIDIGFNEVYCMKCGRKYQMEDITKKETNILPFNLEAMQKEVKISMANARILDGNGNIIKSSGKYSKVVIQPEEYRASNELEPNRAYKVSKTIRLKREPLEEYQNKLTKTARDIFYENLQKKIEAENAKLIKDPVSRTVDIAKNKPTKIKPVPYVVDDEEEPTSGYYVVDRTVDINTMEDIIVPEYDFNKDLVNMIHDVINTDTSYNKDDNRIEDWGYEETDTEDAVSESTEEEHTISDDKPIEEEESSTEDDDSVIVPNPVENTNNLSNDEITIMNAKAIADAILTKHLNFDIIRELSYMSDPEDSVDLDRYENELSIMQMCKDYHVDLNLVEQELRNLTQNNINAQAQNTEDSNLKESMTSEYGTSDKILEDY